MRDLLIVAVVVAGVALLEGSFYAFRFLVDRQAEELKRRLQSLGTQEQGVALLRQGKLSDSAAVDSILRFFAVAERLEKLIEQADVRFTVARLLTYSLVTASGGFLVGAVSRSGIVVSLLLAGIGFAIPIVVVVFMRDRRSAKISEQLPDALDMMARSLRAGHALTSAFKLVASELPEPINLEFGRAFEEQNLGLPFERAVIQMAGRAPQNRDVKIFAVSVIVQKETGGNLVEILEKIADTIRARYRFYGKLRSLTAEARVSGYILGALPILTGLFIAVTNREYIGKLFNEKMGQAFLIYAIVSWLLGFLWMRRMARVDY